nr:hypothetical protein Itr_chr09CG16400 [Ipomoea trifida]GMD31141.1 hypothetical protein Iba_chr09aCG13740 [Ipomoea batatas]GMD36010.1 hypothetical protein Iba_chr09dCG12340 [Ipomoea batatas]GMD37943.1 hypothetical protein Iba_chr09eCG14210 [Ipomoea batatas]
MAEQSWGAWCASRGSPPRLLIRSPSLFPACCMRGLFGDRLLRRYPPGSQEPRLSELWARSDRRGLCQPRLSSLLGQPCLGIGGRQLGQ